MVEIMDSQELKACVPHGLNPQGFNRKATLPYGCSIDHIRSAMQEYLSFLGFINSQLNSKGLPRLESFLMPANFSSMVGEFIVATIPKHCSSLVKNQYHNGHPDLIPSGKYSSNSALHAEQGIEVKASRYVKGWQGHNPENVWLMVFVFDCNTARDGAKGVPPRPFRFIKIVGARLTKNDWQFSGRSSTSRRTITASVKPSGFKKMEKNWIYRDDPVDD